MRTNIKYLVIVILVSFLSQSCYKDIGPIEPEGDLPTDNISFTTDIQPIFDNNCISCHPNSGNLDLTAGNAYSNLVNINASGYTGVLVIPGDSENSILYKKIDGSGNYGSNMPLGSPLSTTQINLIKLWIEQGAHDN